MPVLGPGSHRGDAPGDLDILTLRLGFQDLLESPEVGREVREGRHVRSVRSLLSEEGGGRRGEEGGKRTHQGDARLLGPLEREFGAGCWSPPREASSGRRGGEGEFSMRTHA